ncbi:hypothetical protein AB1L30_16600 [Bremerella sp. JC817]|uniref:hypothetical protein n=1 Tax=Bremerella sp. JC817 TaxID=3231756 RepID=UPI00345A73A3
MVSPDAFNRSLANRIENFRQQLDALIVVFADSTKTPGQRAAQATELAKAAQDIFDILDAKDRPTWILPIMNAASHYASSRNTASGKALFQTILKHHPDIKPIRASVDASNVSFDQVFQRLLQEGNLPELFQTLIEQTEVLIRSGKIESVTALNALQRLLDVVRGNQNGSFVAITQTSFLARYVKNFSVEYLKVVPGLGPAVSAWEKTIDQIDHERDQLQQQLQHESLLAVLDQRTMSRIELLPSQVHLMLDDGGESSQTLQIEQHTMNHNDPSESDGDTTQGQSD